MSLNDKLKTLLLEDLKKLDISLINDYALKNENIINYAYSQKIIDDFSIESALETAVLAKARSDYELMIKEGRNRIIYADHISSPECLAYGLQKSNFSKEEIKNIPFDHNETAETFQKDYNKKNLLSILRKELLEPTPLQKYNKNCCFVMSEYH